MTISNGESGASVRAKLNLGVSEVATLTLNTADILALFTTPKTLIAAPGAGKAIAVVDYTYEAAFNSIRFSMSGSAAMYYAGNTSDAIDDLALTNFIRAAYTQVGLAIVPPWSAQINNSIDRTLVEDKAVMVAAFAAPTAGNGAVYITARYRTYTFQG